MMPTSRASLRIEQPAPSNVVPLQRAHEHTYAVVQVLLHHSPHHPGIWYKLRCVDNCPHSVLIERSQYRALREMLPDADFDPFGVLKDRAHARPVPPEYLS